MNRIYEIEEGRPFWKLRPMQLAVTVAAVVAVAVIAVILVVSGRSRMPSARRWASVNPSASCGRSRNGRCSPSS